MRYIAKFSLMLIISHILLAALFVFYLFIFYVIIFNAGEDYGRDLAISETLQWYSLDCDI